MLVRQGIINRLNFLRKVRSRRMATNTQSDLVRMADGVLLPTEKCSSPFNVIVGHGLGSDPSAKHYHNDISYDLWTNALRHLASARNNKGTTIFYTARGHGDSKEWERCPTDAFQWSNLGKDMLTVANSAFPDDQPFIAFGQSMGAASALYMAMENPNRLQAMIVVRPPRAWEARRKAAHGFVEAAKELQQLKPNTCYHLPLLAAATTDLPRTGYHKVTCPVLILCHGQDEAHPIETGTILKEKIPQSTLKLALNEDEARRVWPEIISDWLLQEGRGAD